MKDCELFNVCSTEIRSVVIIERLPRRLEYYMCVLGD